MGQALEWIDSREADTGVVERSFQLHRPGGTVPGALWLPTAPALGVVLLGHGGSGHKTDDKMASLAGWFASQARLAAVAIDGPYHGERVADPLTASAYQARIAAEGIGVVLDRMAADWTATVDAIGALGLVDTVSIGYVGVSMGTRFGLPLAAAMGNRLRCVVFGKFGLRQGPFLDAGLCAPERFAADARRVTVPTLFHLQLQDEIFPRDGQLELFDLLAAPDKELIGYSGTHAETKPAAIARWRDFVCGHLAPLG